MNKKTTMRILWISNIILPEASRLLGEKVNPFEGWKTGLTSFLSNNEGIDLSIAFPKAGCRGMQKLLGEKVSYYIFPPVSPKDVLLSNYQAVFKQILTEARPDLTHIFGTEYPHTLAWVNILEKERVVISIQGLVSVYAGHYLAGIPPQISNRFTFRDFIRQDNPRQQQRKFVNRGKFEIEALRKVKQVIGRTTWDKACVTRINPDIHYHFCNETLRETFYQKQWALDKCQRHSLFISQGYYPIKGLHFMLEAMPEIIRRYPDAHLYIAGSNITATETFQERLKLTSYGKYLRALIKKFDLAGHITFTGILDEKSMRAQFLQAHVFVLTSSVENSPNSLGEAMLLGVPCVASQVGGVSDLLRDKEEGLLYPYDEAYMLAHYVRAIFADDELALKLSNNARIHAVKTHDRKEIGRRMLEIYRMAPHRG